MRRKYLILNLERFVSEDSQKPNYPDLLLKTLKIKRSPYRILQNRFKMSYYLNELVNEHDYGIVIYGNGQKKQIQMITNLMKACKENNLADLPKVTAIAVSDPECFASIKSSKPIIFNYRRHNMNVAGYDQNTDGSACALEALSKMLKISESERKNHILIDTAPSTIEKANLEGWRAYHIKQDSLINALVEIYLQEISDQPLISDQEFELSNEKVKGGSSINLGWYIDKTTNHKWLGKCSGDSIIVKSNPPLNSPGYSLYKERLASILYNLLRVTTPKTTLSYQMLIEEKIKGFQIDPTITGTPKLHLMSQYVDSFFELGPRFVGDYKKYQPRNYYFSVTKQNLPLRGFGRAIAIAILLHDFDCIGNSGGNMGYITKSGYAEIVKIDPGEALSFADDMSKSEGLENPPDKREAIIGTGQYRIHFDELNKRDQEEFAQTIKEILNIPDSWINETTKSFLSIDDRFETIRKRLLQRKNNLLSAFSTEVRELLLQQMDLLENRKFNECINSWDKPNRLSFSDINDNKVKLMEEFSRLEATKLLHNSEKIIKFQIPHSERIFIGRQKELKRMRDIFHLSNQNLTYIALVGTAGFGKTQLAVEYVIQNQKEYSHIIWLNGEKTVLLLLQIQNYMQIYVNPQKNSESFKGSSYDQIRLDPFFKNSLLKDFYQSFNVDISKGNPKKICLVIDNTENMKDIIDYLPTPAIAPTCKLDIIITSRYRNWSGPIEHKINLQTFSVEEAKLCVSTQLDVTVSYEEAVKLHKLLDGVPIAISLAIASMKKSNQCITDYCNKILNHHDPMVGEDEECNAFAKVMIPTMTDLRNKNSQVKMILDILAYFSPDHITLSFLKECWRHCLKEEGKEVKAQEEKEFKEGIDLLESYSIISQNNVQSPKNQCKKEAVPVFGDKNKEDEIEVHRLTQKVIRFVHNKNQFLTKHSERMIHWLFPKLDFLEEDLSAVVKVRPLIPHAIYLSEMEELNDKRNLWMELKFVDTRLFVNGLRSIGDYQQNVAGDYDQARKYFLKSLKVQECLIGVDCLEICVSLMRLSFVCGLLGQYEEQKKFIIRGLTIVAPEIAKILMLVTFFVQKATELFNATFKNGKVRFRLMDRMTSAIAKVLKELNCYDKPIALLVEVLNVYDHDHWKDDEMNFRLLASIGFSWGCLGNLEKQADFWTRSLQMSQRIYGKDHIFTGENLLCLSHVWRDLKNYEKQKNALNEAMKIFRNKLGDQHPLVGTVTTELADVWGLLGDPKKKGDLLSQAMEIFKRAYGDGHIQIGTILKSLADVSGILRNESAKRENLNKALKIYEKHYGKNHPETVNIENSKGFLIH